MLPDPDVAIAFSCYRDARGRPADPQAIVVGPVVTPRPFVVTAGYEMTAVKIRIEAAKRVLAAAPAEHRDALRPLADVLPRREAAALRDALCGTRDAAQALAVLTAHVGQRSERAQERLDAARYAMRLIRETAGRAPVDAIARRVGVPERTLRRRILQEADVSPKTYARLVRFLHALDLADRTIGDPVGPDWADIAASAGYCDQSHLVRDFHLLCGSTPGDVFRERSAEAVLPAGPTLALG